MGQEDLASEIPVEDQASVDPPPVEDPEKDPAVVAAPVVVPVVVLGPENQRDSEEMAPDRRFLQASGTPEKELSDHRDHQKQTYSPP